MNCPLKTQNPKLCSEIGCAWWKKTDGACAILSIAVDLTLLLQIQERKEEESNESRCVCSR